MLPDFPRDLIAEMYLDGWQNITSDVFQRDPISIKRGRGSEAAKVQPSTCSLTLKNTSGDWSPQNPMGPHYGLLGRNAPFRLSFRKMTDTFTRTVVDGWGTGDTGDVWDVAVGVGSSSASDWSVGSGVATHSVAAANAYRLSYMSGSPLEDAEVRVSCTVAINNITGGPIEPANIILRAQDTDTYYLARVSVSETEALTISIRLHDGTETEIAAPVTVAGVVDSSSSKTIDVAFQCEGPMLRAKVWETGETEPAGWHVSASDTTITGPGAMGIRSGVASSNTNTKPILFSYDNFEVRIPRAAGELAKLTPRWDVSHTDRYSKLDVAGIMRRLDQGTSPAISALRSFVEGNAVQPSAYWPLDDGRLATDGRVTVGDGRPVLIFDGNFPATTQFEFGDGELSPWLPPGVNIAGSKILTCRLPVGTSLSSAYTVDWVLAYKGGRYSTNTHNDRMTFGTVSEPAWTLIFWSFSYELELLAPSGASVGTFEMPEFYDGSSHHLRLYAEQTGADIIYFLRVDGVTQLTGLLAGATNAALSRVTYQQDGHQEDMRSRSIGHVAIYAGDGPTIADAVDAAFGLPGETAGRRIERLCADAGVPFFPVGDLDATQPMGPQRTAPLLEQLEEAATLDGATLFEPRGAVGLAYRTLASLYTQTPTLELDYSAFHIAPDLEPVFDDQLTRNSIKAKRTDGGDYTIEQTTGPLNVNDPGDDPNGVGLYDTSLTVNAETDAQLVDIANWALHLGTVPDHRYPQVRIDLRAPDITSALGDAVLAMGVDDRFTIDGMATVHQFDTVDQLARGYTEVITNAYQHSITFNTAPAGPYNVLILDDATYGRLDASDSTLDPGETSSDTTVGVATSTLRNLWTTNGSELPLDIKVNGERMTVSAIGAEFFNGALWQQNFTVTRSVNGVVKAHSAGTPVSLADPVYLGVVA